MQKHHWYLIVGGILAGVVSWLLPSLFGPGLGVVIAGIIDMLYGSPVQQK